LGYGLANIVAFVNPSMIALGAALLAPVRSSRIK